MKDWKQIRELYMVPKDIVYLNNGSYGPAPRPVFDALVGFMTQLEENPSVYDSQYERLLSVVKPRIAVARA